MKKLFAGAFILLCTLSLFACNFGSSNEQFGRFTHNGYALTSFKTKDITYSDANTIITKNSTTYTNIKSTTTSSNNYSLSESEIISIMNLYSSVTITTKYWNNDEHLTQKNEVYLSANGDSKYPDILAQNQNTIGTGMVINNIVLTPTLLSYYNNINDEFIASENYSSAPFKNKYSYHTNDDDNFVLRVNDYSSNNSSITGTSTMEIHETESLYDENNMLTYYQASFGFSYATPGDTSYIGTVLEVSFVWNLKV